MLTTPNYDNIINNIKDKYPKLKGKKISPRFDTFIQIWGSTALGFDVDESGNAMVAGQVMTEAYTTVCNLSDTLWIVCFGEEPCYAVENPTDKFFAYIRDRCMASRSEAKKRY